MDEKKPQTEQGEYQFIREKVIRKKRSRLLRLVLLVSGTIFLAVLFGFCARLVFSLSEPYVNIILGITMTPTPTQPEKIPVQIASTVPSPTITVTPVPTVTTVPTQTEEPGEDEACATEAPAPTQIPPIIVENRINATLSDFIMIYQDIRKLAESAAAAIAPVNVITNGTDWFNETYEDSTLTSGIIIGNNGLELLILVSADRLTDADRIEVNVGGYIAAGTVTAYDEDYNLAVIGVAYNTIPEKNIAKIDTAKFGESYNTYVGAPVLAIGNPNGYSGSFELGIITSSGSYAYVIDDRLELINTSISDHQNGDGVLINTSGNIIGIITHKFKKDLNAEINTVVGISRLKAVIEQLVNEQQMNYFGITAEEIPQEVQKENGLTEGIYIRDVAAGSPAEQAGVKKGDILTSLNEEPVKTVAGFHTKLTACIPGDVVNVTVNRAVQQLYTEITLQAVIGTK